MRQHTLSLGLASLMLMVSSTTNAAEITQKHTVKNTNAVQAGVGGIGSAGTGTITVAGVSGTVTKAYLFWHGIGSPAYNNASVSINGNAVTGVSQGDSGTNCWGPGGSRTYLADVTSRVTGNGAYALSGLASGAEGNNANGASLAVFFNDGNNSNNRDFVIFSGNDSTHEGTNGDGDGWSASLPGIAYAGGAVRATLHVADGQSFGANDDGSLAFSTADGSANIPDTGIFDGTSVPNSGNGRGGQTLYDVHTFDISAAFTSNGNKTLSVTAPGFGDCLAMTAMVVDVGVGSAPPSPGDETTTCASEGYTGTQLTWCKNICEKGYTGATLDMWIRRWMGRWHDLPYCAREDEGGEEPPPQGG